MKIFKGSWKTTLLGIMAGLGILFTQATAFLDDDPATVVNIAQILAGFAAMGLGVASRDNNRTSEEVKANIKK